MQTIKLTARYSDGSKWATEEFTAHNAIAAITTAHEWWTPMRGCTHANIGWPFNPFATVSIDGAPEVPVVALAYPDQFDALAMLLGFAPAERLAA